MRFLPKFSLLLALMVGLSLSGTALATATFTNQLNDQDMGNPSNWDQTLESGNNAQIDYAKFDDEVEPGILGTGDTITCQKFRIGWTDSDTKMIIDGGTMNSGRGSKKKSFWIAENDASDTGHLEMLSGSIDHDQGHFWVGGEGHGTMLMTGGTIDVESNMALAFQTTGVGELTMEGGSIIVGGDLEVARKGKGTFDMTGGSITAGSAFRMTDNSTAAGDMDLHGGTVEALFLDIGTGVNGDPNDGFLDIAYDGKLILDGDATDEIADLIANGDITSLGTDQLTVTTDRTAGVTEITGIPEPATVAMLGLGGLVLLRRKRK